MQGKAIIKFVDVWKNRQAADGFPIQLIPTQVLVNSEKLHVPEQGYWDRITKYVMKDNGRTFTVHQRAPDEENTCRHGDWK